MLLISSCNVSAVLLCSTNMESLAELSKLQKSELVVSLAALLLEDAEVELSAENLDTVVKVRESPVPTLLCIIGLHHCITVRITILSHTGLWQQD